MANIAHYKKIIEQRTAAKEVFSILTTKASVELERQVAEELVEEPKLDAVEEKKLITANVVKPTKVKRAEDKGAAVTTKQDARHGDEF